MPNRAGMKFKSATGTNQADTRWLAEFTDELDVMIAQREFDAAVAGIEKGMQPFGGATLALNTLCMRFGHVPKYSRILHPQPP